jgi:hypothetical protein
LFFGTFKLYKKGKGKNNMEILQQFIVLPIMAICLCLGYIIKHSLDFIPNKYIPLIIGVCGLALNIFAQGGQFSIDIMLGGLASGLASTGAFEIVKNVMKKEEEK